MIPYTVERGEAMGMEQKNHYIKWGVTLFTVIAASIVLLMILLNLDEFFSTLRAGLKIIAPITYGAVFAYLLNPIVNRTESLIAPLLAKTKLSPEKRKRRSRAIGVTAAMIVGGLIVYATISLILPQLTATVTALVSNLPSYFRNAEAWVLRTLENNPELRQYANDAMDKLYSYFNGLLETDILGNIQSVLLTVTSSVYSVIREVINMVIGVIVAVYILLGKDKFIAQGKKIMVATMREDRANYLMEVLRQTHRIFSGFVVGKLIDSAIIGVLCYVGLLILRMPYQILIATIIGITNIIPFFGPIIGAVPTALLVLLVSPIQCVYFILFILALQQLDGNVIGPRILGNTVGISGFWVLVSITVASGLFGFAGMILGVPVFAVVYMLIDDRICHKLLKKGKTTATSAYFSIQKVEDLDASEPPKTEEPPTPEPRQ